MVMNSDGRFMATSNTDNTASSPTGNANDKSGASPGVAMAPDMGSMPPAAPMAASNASQVVPHMTSCAGDAGLCKAIGNAVAMHEGQ